MKAITIKEVENGFSVELIDDNVVKPYVYKSTELFKMFEELGKWLYGRKIKVEEK